jgi:hypothetical protein
MTDERKKPEDSAPDMVYVTDTETVQSTDTIEPKAVNQ